MKEDRFNENKSFFQNKKAGGGSESLLMIFRIVLVSIIALIILGSSAYFYDYYINVRDSEANILEEQILDCVLKNGNLIEIPNEYNQNILDFCKIKNSNQFFVNVTIYDSDFNSIKQYIQGDSGFTWISTDNTNGKHKLGHSLNQMPIFFDETRGELKIEIFVNHEF
ncbi:MAG: hypothetical protein ACOYT4_04370 [Nanoarchaeota archaeon]